MELNWKVACFFRIFPMEKRERAFFIPMDTAMVTLIQETTGYRGIWLNAVMHRCMLVCGDQERQKGKEIYTINTEKTVMILLNGWLISHGVMGMQGQLVHL